MRRDITELLLRDFGYSYEKADKRLLKRFNGRGYADLTEAEQLQYDRLKQRWEAFDDWFIYDERQVIVDCLREITKHVFIANSIYPTCPEEFAQRRLHQDEAIGQCYRLTQELENINNGVNEIKSDMRNMRNDIQDLRDRLIIVEQSTKSAHHRLDGLDGHNVPKDGGTLQTGTLYVCSSTQT